MWIDAKVINHICFAQINKQGMTAICVRSLSVASSRWLIAKDQGTWKRSIWVSTIHGPGRQTYRYGSQSIYFKMHMATLKGFCCQFEDLSEGVVCKKQLPTAFAKKHRWGDRCGWLNLDLQQVMMVWSCYPAIFYHLLSASKVLVHRPSQVGSKTLNSPTVHRFRLAHLWKGLNIVLETGQAILWLEGGGQIRHGCSLFIYCSLLNVPRRSLFVWWLQLESWL